MDKPDVRVLAEDVPAEVPDDVKRRAITHSCVFADPSIQAFVERRIISAIMADRRATRETAKAEGAGIRDFRTTEGGDLQQGNRPQTPAAQGVEGGDQCQRKSPECDMNVAAAKAEGRRQGLEEAAKVAEGAWFSSDEQWRAQNTAAAIRAIAQKAEG